MSPTLLTPAPGSETVADELTPAYYLRHDPLGVYITGLLARCTTVFDIKPTLTADLTHPDRRPHPPGPARPDRGRRHRGRRARHRHGHRPARRPHQSGPQGADLTGADLTGAEVTGANLKGVRGLPASPR
ncbi:pentapeptide repeat-containing protein [Streptomyces sp. NPDC089919]|uniref:pentapeptide repeat-containing protein n=1 Tax=Streptomyces sp. NPDC089919 TaxID=3155188 RepID=UPI0034382133